MARLTDNTADQYTPPPHVKVVYARPSDRTNRFTTYAPVIQAGVRATSDYFLLEASDRSIRFDLGTTEGDSCVDIQTVNLPGTQSHYQSPPGACGGLLSPGDCTFVTLLEDVQDRLDDAGPLGNRNFLVYADWVTRPDAGGQAIRLDDDDPGGAAHNGGGLFAVVYGFGGTDFQGSAQAFPEGLTSYFHTRTVIHEITHTLGAVQNSAPRATDFAHCFDEWDLMCYADGGPFGGPEDLTFPCAASPYSSTHEALDCGRNDYMSPSPASSSYLDTHWNTYDSVFLCAFFGTPGCAPEDTDDPDTRIYSPGGPTSDPTPTFVFGPVGEPAASFTCSIDGPTGSSCTSPWTTPPLEDGPHTLRVRAFDTSNNVDPSPALLEFSVDTVAPNTTVAGRRRYRTRKPRRAVRFALASNESGARFSCRVDSGAWFRCPPSFLTPRLRRGRHTVSARAIDGVGLTDPTPATLNFRIVRRKKRR